MATDKEAKAIALRILDDSVRGELHDTDQVFLTNREATVLAMRFLAAVNPIKARK